MQIHELMERVVFLSTDTTGFNADDELLRVTLVDSEGGIIYSQLVIPPSKTTWESAQHVHGISPEDVEINGIPFEKLHGALSGILNHYSHIVMYNAEFHKRFMPQECLRNKTIVCAMLWSLLYVNNHPSYASLSNFLKLPVLGVFLEVELAELARNSVNNCKLTRKVWLEMLSNASKLENEIGKALIKSITTDQAA